MLPASSPRLRGVTGAPQSAPDDTRARGVTEIAPIAGNAADTRLRNVTEVVALPAAGVTVNTYHQPDATAGDQYDHNL
jgi:hypothetical protein